ncbi:MAG: alpha/beta hydrolase [Candidatus Lambdaproteobacteria bacterium]|nr:alpha/beta hydrolase [Candidatus Lambdaproteobacteria bacterium]
MNGNGSSNGGTREALQGSSVSPAFAARVRKLEPGAGDGVFAARAAAPGVAWPEPVLLLHGGGNHAGHWRQVMEGYLPARQLSAIDLHGSGRTGLLERAREFSLDDEAELVEAEVRRLGGRAHVVGHSYGGAVALRVAERARVDVLSLAVIEPILPRLMLHLGETELFEQARRGVESFWELVRLNRHDTAMAWFVDAFNGEGTWRALPEDKRARLTAMAPGVALGTQALADNPARPEALARIAVPTTVLHGACTGARERRMAELAAQVIPGSRLAILPGAAHMSPLTHPGLVREAIVQHLRWAARPAGGHEVARNIPPEGGRRIAESECA